MSRAIVASRLLWFVGLWCAGVASLAALAFAIRAILPH